MTSGTWIGYAGAQVQAGKLPANALTTLPFGSAVGPQFSLAYGTGSGQADLYVVQFRTLAFGAAETLDLYAGTVLDVFGDAAAFRTLRQVVLWVYAGGDAAGVTVGNAAANPHPLFFGATTQTWGIYPSGPGLVGGSLAGVAVSTTARNLKVLNNGAVSVTYGLALAGGSV
jgi:hypothetical protein